jgi:hypothetical protein
LSGKQDCGFAQAFRRKLVQRKRAPLSDYL